MWNQTFRRQLAAIAAFFFLLLLHASAEAVKPISRKGLLDALQIGGLTQSELELFVKQRGVDFKLASREEAELLKAGASQGLLDAVKASYRPPAHASTPASTGKQKNAHPLSKAEIVTLLQVGTPSSRIMELAAQRGIAFQLTPQIASELESAGADSDLIGALNRLHPSETPLTIPRKAPIIQHALVAQASNTPPEAAPAPLPTPPPAPQPAAPAPPPSPKITSLQEVKTIFVDKMPDDLDQYIRAEITKQLKGRLTVTLVRKQADAILTGVAESHTGTGSMITGRYLGLHDTASGSVSVLDATGTKVLWSEEAGDRSLWFGALKRGGPRKVADRLVGKLRRAMAD
ncbi:MAG: hypothetical protein IT167_11055 [Bryobacterales bacterium]|nr:hypothetical protein [Bryobacterales bacterium]